MFCEFQIKNNNTIIGTMKISVFFKSPARRLNRLVVSVC